MLHVCESEAYAQVTDSVSKETSHRADVLPPIILGRHFLSLISSGGKGSHPRIVATE